jgi:4-diphosphocytidyl-2-C-methyl-D-erythritol kinase
MSSDRYKRDCPAPAKLNLFLHVLNRREDGYHELQTLFDLIDLHDTMHFSVRFDGQISLQGGLAGLAAEDDLSVKAARLLAAESQCGLGADIELIKRIPAGGGLGGGSSNAATTLMALNRLWDLRWPAARLADLGLKLGADVPVFVHGEPAVATGVGEMLTPVSLPKQQYVVIAPPVGVPTANIFTAPELTRESKPLKISPLSRGRIGIEGKNDLEPVACSLYPQVKQALAALTSASAASQSTISDLVESTDSAESVSWSQARMSGSGSCVFIPVPDTTTAAAVSERASAMQVGKVYTVTSLDRHPLRDWAFANQ